MKKVLVLMSALLFGVAISANAQDNKSTTQSPRETHNVSSRPNTQSPRETHKVNNNTDANSRRPSIAPKQKSDNRTTSPRSTNNNDRVQRDATKSSQYENGKLKN